MIRVGLYCAFRDEPVRFVHTTAAATARLPRRDALAKLGRLCLQNGSALPATLQICAVHGIGCSRGNRLILPLKTHPELGYELTELPDGPAQRRTTRPHRGAATDGTGRTGAAG